MASYNKTFPNQTHFPPTEVAICYTVDSINLAFTAHNETSFYYNPSQGTNKAIWEYEVMETFIALGDKDPQTYLEFEVNPNNVTFQAFIYNPGKVRADGAAQGTKWRMNFFRTVVAPDTFPNQTLSAWSPPDKASFHMTPFFGHVEFI